MSLRLKINLIVGALTALFVASLLGLQLRSMREAVREEVVAANRVAAQLLNRTVMAYAAQGAPTMLAFLEGVGRVRSNEITLLDDQGRELYTSPPSPYKAGREAPRWFAALVEPTPTFHSLDFPGGKMVVRSNASRAVIDAWDEFIVLGSTGLALLVGVNALVFWLVGRTVRPFGRIVEALNQLEAGRFDAKLPALPGTEASAIGAAFNRMVSVLQDNLEAERRALRAERELSDSRELGRWIDQRLEQERRMIARELHDELGQSVTAIRSMALSVAQRAQHKDPQSAEAARLIADESSRLYDAMHGLIPRLTPLVLDSFGLDEALHELVERTLRSQPELQLELHVALGDARLHSEAALAVYRAAQEGITNALQHGHARHVRIDVRITRQGGAAELQLDLSDDGEGLAPDWAARKGHYGLRWLTERAEGLGGRFSLEPEQPHGARLQLRLPVMAADNGSA